METIVPYEKNKFCTVYLCFLEYHFICLIPAQKNNACFFCSSLLMYTCLLEKQRFISSYSLQVVYITVNNSDKLKETQIMSPRPRSSDYQLATLKMRKLQINTLCTIFSTCQQYNILYIIAKLSSTGENKVHFVSIIIQNKL